jgi:hypothetical protein
MGPGVPREARLVCVCTNEFAQTLPSALRQFVANASTPYRTAGESSCSPTMRRGKLPELPLWAVALKNRWSAVHSKAASR